MTPAERADLLAKLEAGRMDLLASIDGLSDIEAVVKPAEGRWSAIDNVEHLAIVETNLLKRLQEASPIAAEPVPGREAVIFERIKMRTTKISAPAPAHPTGECLTLAAAIGRFEAARGRTVAFLESCDRDLRACSMTHPVIGPITGMECLLMLAGHPFRHAAQIRELRAG